MSIAGPPQVEAKSLSCGWNESATTSIYPLDALSSNLPKSVIAPCPSDLLVVSDQSAEFVTNVTLAKCGKDVYMLMIETTLAKKTTTNPSVSA